MPTKAARLTCATIADLDNGSFGVLVNDEIAKICSDLDDRGHDGQTRKLILTLEFARDMERSPNEPAISIDPRVEAKFPAHRSGVTVSKLASDKAGEIGFLFQAQNAEDPDQPSLLDDDAK